MEEYSTEDLSDRLWSYFQRRNYLEGDVIIRPELNLSSDEMALAAAIDKDASNRNVIAYSTFIHDITQAESQYSQLKSWIYDLGDEKCQEELVPLLMPLLCHMFLDGLRNNHLHALHKFAKRLLVRPVYTDDWNPVVDQLLAIESDKDIETQPLLHILRTSKFHLKLSPRTVSLLRRFLSSRSLHIVIQVMQMWFELETITEDVANFEEEINSSFIRLGEQDDESDDDYDDEEYINVNDSEMEQLVTEINKMRSQPTPPPPLLLYTAHKTEGIVCGRVSADGRLAATGDQNSEVRVWGLCETRLSPQLHPDYFADARISAYTETLKDSQQQKEKQWWSLRGHCDTVYDVVFLSDCEYLISVSFDTTMRLWRMNDFSCAAVYRGHSSPVWGCAVSPVHNLVATASSDKTARIWSLDRTYPLRIMAGHLQDVLCVAFHPNGSYIATGSVDRTVRLWSVTDGSLVRVFGGHPEQGSVETVAFSPNGQYAASAGSDKYVWLWDLAGGSLVYQLAGHTSRIVSIDWSHDGSTVSACSFDGTVLLWSLDCDMACVGGTKPKKYITKCSTLLSLQYSTKNALVGVGLA